MCEDFRRLCNEIGLKKTKINKNSSTNHYYFYIKSREKLLELIDYFKGRFFLISLDYKEEKLRHYFEIKKHPGLRTKKGGDERKKRILNSLKQKKKNVNELSKELFLLPRSIRKHLKILVKSKNILKEKIGAETYFFLGVSH